MIRRLFAPLALAAALASASAPLLAGTFVPHRAVYAMTLDSARTGSGIAAVRGEMAVQWVRDCQGWTFEHRSIMDIVFVESESVRLATRASSWEADDSMRYTFTLRHTANGEETERVEGTARMGETGGGTVVFTAPDEKRIPLPDGTLFPVAHSVAVLDAAARMDRTATLTRTLFDGMGDDGPFEVNAVLSPAATPQRPNAAAAPLAKLDAYRLSLAYFPVGAAAPEPRHEMAMRLYANGVADDLSIDFEDFSVRAALERVELLEIPACKE